MTYQDVIAHGSPARAAVEARRRRPASAIRYGLVIAFLMLGFCGASALMLAELRRDVWTLANTGAQNLLTVLSQDIDTNIRSYDRVLTGIAEKLAEPEFARLDPDLQQAYLFKAAAIEPYFTNLYVLDRAGEVVRDGGTGARRIDDFAGMAFFRTQAAGHAGGLVVSRPFDLDPAGGDPVIALSRRISAADGSFAGVVVGMLRLGYFREIFDHTRLNAGDAVNLFSQDGILLMRSPYRADQIGRDLSDTPNVRRFRAEDSGGFTGVSAVDQVTRVYNFNHIGDLPLILNVALSRDGIYAAWRVQAFAVAVVLAFLCALTTALGLVVRRAFRRRSRAEAASRTSEAQYRLLADHATDVILRLDRDLRRQYVSPATRTMLGYEPGELLGRRTVELIHPEDLPIVEAIVGETRTSHAPAEAVYRIRHRAGHHVWVEGRYSFLPEDDGFIVVLRDISKRKSAESKLASAHAELARRADTDGLTGLANRRCFDETLQAAIARAAEADAPLSLLLIDVDRFKLFNDEYGHPAGDECLKRVARAIEGSVRPGDLCARYGGEELVVILPGARSDAAFEVAERIRRAVEALGIPHAAGEGGCVTGSVGCAAWDGAAGPEALIEAADRFLYEAKRTGRNKVVSAAVFAANDRTSAMADEPARLATVARYRDRLGPDGSPGLDAIARGAAELFQVPMGFVSLVGRDDLTLIGCHGLDRGTFPREGSFCSFTIAGVEPLVVRDAAGDPRFADGTAAAGDGMRFYAGAPVVDPQNGMTIGALCVADVRARDSVSVKEREMLKALCERVVSAIMTEPAPGA